MKNSIVIFFVLLYSIVNAQTVSLDFSLNNSGTAVTDIGSTNDYASSVTVQADGKILVAGRSYNGTVWNFVVLRYNSDGSLDTSFDGDGKLINNFSGTSIAMDIIIQPDAKILVCGSTTVSGVYYYTLIRLNVDGSFDTSFSGDGIAQEDIGFVGASGAGSMVLQSDGKIIVGGYKLIRFNSDGTLDTTFNSTPLSFLCCMAADFYPHILLQADGKIAVSQGGFNGLDEYYYYMGRFNNDGSVDTTFGGYDMSFGGEHEVPMDFTGEILQQPDGKLLIAGGSPLSAADSSVVRLNANGSFDSGTHTYFGTTSFYPRSIQMQTDGKVIVSGFNSNGTSYDFALVRMNNDLTIDTTFGPDNGIVTTDFGLDDFIYTSALMPDGRIVVAGYTDTYGTTDFAIARYNANAVGIEENKNENALDVYPNPVSDQLTISSKTTFNNASLKLMDVSGQLVLTQQNICGNNFKLDVLSLPSGLYLVEITENGAVSRVKLVKE